MIFYFSNSLREDDLLYKEIKNWLNADKKIVDWSFLRMHTVPFGDVFDGIIFTDLEDAVIFRIKYGYMIALREG